MATKSFLKKVDLKKKKEIKNYANAIEKAANKKEYNNVLDREVKFISKSEISQYFR